MLAMIRQSWLLFALMALVAVSSALDLNGINEFIHMGKRQVASGTGNTRTPTSTQPPPPSSTPETSEPPSSTPPTTTEPETSTPSSTPPPTSSERTTPSSRPPSSTPPPSSTRPSSTPVTIITTPLLSSSIQLYTTVYTTVSDGSSIVRTDTSSSTLVMTTGQAVITSTPGVNKGDGNGGSSGGLSDSSKKIIGGVVGGVGGAILLGGIAIVCWRIWGRNKRVTEDDADLMAGTGSALGDKSSTPFQSNLEQYHNPGGRPNAAANF